MKLRHWERGVECWDMSSTESNVSALEAATGMGTLKAGEGDPTWSPSFSLLVLDMPSLRPADLSRSLGPTGTTVSSTVLARNSATCPVCLSLVLKISYQALTAQITRTNASLSLPVMYFLKWYFHILRFRPKCISMKIQGLVNWPTINYTELYGQSWGSNRNFRNFNVIHELGSWWIIHRH